MTTASARKEHQQWLLELTAIPTAAGREGESMPEEFVLADLQHARQALEEVTGRRAPEDLLAHIFSRFCIGK